MTTLSTYIKAPSKISRYENANFFKLTKSVGSEPASQCSSRSNLTKKEAANEVELVEGLWGDGQSKMLRNKFQNKILKESLT